ncbi:unnamed protein product [Gongylonema pulchrum]|uniref:GPI ethanolamine phosphate transferase 3 n=1 Tax=Gongylonema pulchrum TaxID=637853 RepID=A0A183E9L4_9BILA|nr:unnamed protein product [Gongylonema pulchrum]
MKNRIRAHLINTAFLGISLAISLLLFQRGFLLKRVELSSRSSCSDVATPRGACWLPAQYDRAVIILIDALRHDFILPPTDLNNTAAYLGHMHTIAGLLANHSDSAVLMQFHADPPTTTMQRLKALTTGSLPTFIDASSNFASTAVMEDNWIDQIVATNRSVIMLGDRYLFIRLNSNAAIMPHLSILTISIQSTENLYKELSKSDWNVLLAHFLGVDHCGHKYGPDHPAMARKLKQMNGVIKKVLKYIDNKTLLVVDIVPTLSLLLDMPIPYSSIGTLIDCVIDPEHRSVAISSNAEQMMRYGRTVVAETELPELDLLIREFETNGNVNNSIDYMHRLQDLLRVSWTEFNDNFMRIGFLSLVDAVLAIYDALYTG